jgi:hypothetical protein
MKLFSCVAACFLLAACGQRPAESQASAPAVPVPSASVDLSGLREPFKTVVPNYLVIEQKLAVDSTDGVPAAASAIKQAVAADQGKTFDADFAREVDQLVAAADLHATRIAFQSLSGTLIAALAKNHVQTGLLHVAFCPMVKASWIQTDGQAIHNPYMGSQMPDCGAFREQY